VYVSSAGGDGIQVNSAGDTGVRVAQATNDGVLVSGAGSHGLRVESAVSSGLKVDATQGRGVHVYSSDLEGLLVSWADYHGLSIYSAGSDGVRVSNAGANGVFVNSAGQDGVYANTTRSDGEWGFETPDKISGSNVALSSLTVIAQVTGDRALAPGDVVAAVGVTDPLPDSTVSLALVQLANAATPSGIVGVVEGRMTLVHQPSDEDETDHDPIPMLRSADGAAQPGDYVALTVLGVAQVKIAEKTEIEPGQRLTISDVAGRARALRTETLNGMVVSEGTPVIGTALAAPQPGQDTIPVFVTLR
jgi:hypothetical protein